MARRRVRWANLGRSAALLAAGAIVLTRGCGSPGPAAPVQPLLPAAPPAALRPAPPAALPPAVPAFGAAVNGGDQGGRARPRRSPPPLHSARPRPRPPRRPRP